MPIERSEKVMMHPACRWDCPGCSATNFITIPERSPANEEDAALMREKHLVKLTFPDTVMCGTCMREYEIDWQDEEWGISELGSGDAA